MFYWVSGGLSLFMWPFAIMWMSWILIGYFLFFIFYSYFLLFIFLFIIIFLW